MLEAPFFKLPLSQLEGCQVNDGLMGSLFIDPLSPRVLPSLPRVTSRQALLLTLLYAVDVGEGGSVPHHGARIERVGDDAPHCQR